MPKIPLEDRSAEGVRKLRLDLMTRKRITQEVAKRYRKASKKEKGRMLDEFCALTGYNRSYAAWVLRKGPPVKERAGKAPVRTVGLRRGRKPIYTAEVKKALVKVWAILDCPCGKRLVVAMPHTLEALERFGEIRLSDEVREKLLSVSAATCDRLLAHDRRRLEIRSRHKTKPGSLLKHQIPVRTFSDWDEGRVGFLEVDLVGHDGGGCERGLLPEPGCHGREERVDRAAGPPQQGAGLDPPGHRGHQGEAALPPPGPGLGQRIGVHKHPPQEVLRGA